MELLVTPLDAPTQMQSESIAFLGIEAGELEHMARRAGASNVQLLGSYNGQPYDRDDSTDLIVIAGRGIARVVVSELPEDERVSLSRSADVLRKSLAAFDS